MHLHGMETVKVCLGVQEGRALGKGKEEVEGKEDLGTDSLWGVYFSS